MNPKKYIYLTILSTFLLVGCSQKNQIEVPSQTTVTTTTSSVKNPIIYIEGVSSEALGEYLEKYWNETDVKNVYRYWEPGNELPIKTEPDEYEGIWLDFNNQEQVTYYYNENKEVIKSVYNWQKDVASIGDCNYDFKTREAKGECTDLEGYDVESNFRALKESFNSRWKSIKKGN